MKALLTSICVTTISSPLGPFSFISFEHFFLAFKTPLFLKAYCILASSSIFYCNFKNITLCKTCKMVSSMQIGRKDLSTKFSIPSFPSFGMKTTSKAYKLFKRAMSSGRFKIVFSAFNNSSVNYLPYVLCFARYLKWQTHNPDGPGVRLYLILYMMIFLISSAVTCSKSMSR